MTRDDERTALWKPPTRRGFVAMLGAGFAALTVRFSGWGSGADAASKEPEKAPGIRWIGHR